MTELPRIMGLAELKGEGAYYDGFKRAEVSPSWRDRLAKWLRPEWLRAALDLQAENQRLRVKLLEAVRACEDAGRIGLQLYDENELLREQIETGPQERLVRLHDLDKLANENRDLKDKLKRSYGDYNCLHEQVNEWIAEFGEKE